MAYDTTERENSDLRSTRLVMYVLWDWCDGGFTEGW